MVIRSCDRAPMNEISAFIKEAPEDALPFLPCEDTDVLHEEASPQQTLCQLDSTLFLNLSPPEL